MISLIHPSRGRPFKSNDTVMKWSNDIRAWDKWVELIISLDEDDPTRGLYHYEWQYPPYVHGEIISNKNKSVVDATNEGAKKCEGDILVYLSDDFDCPKYWDELIEKEFEGVTEPMLLKVDDCLQKFHVPVLTIPIMNRALYEKLGYFWNPLYKSMFVDEDLYWTCHKLNGIKYAPHLKFPHNHVSVGKAQDDETYRRSAANWNQGKEVFARRKAAGFPL